MVIGDPMFWSHWRRKDCMGQTGLSASPEGLWCRAHSSVHMCACVQVCVTLTVGRGAQMEGSESISEGSCRRRELQASGTKVPLRDSPTSAVDGKVTSEISINCSQDFGAVARPEWRLLNGWFLPGMWPPG